MQTKRKYAHELYPHAAEGETRPLAVEVPYLYARAMGMDVSGTGWFDQIGELSSARTNTLIQCRQIALMADAMLQGLTGDEAWEWADHRTQDETGEWTWERAAHYGIDPEAIKPYPCGPEPEHHNHLDEPNARGWRIVNRVKGKESECHECCTATTEGI